MNFNRRLQMLFAATLLSCAISQSSYALVFSKNVPKEVQTQMLSDLQMIEQIQATGATPIFTQIFSGRLNGLNLLQFFSSRIQGVDLHDCGDKAAIACVRPNIDSRIMWLTKNYTNLQTPQMFRLSVIFHESRHTEKANRYWGHLNCPTPFRDPQGKDIRGIVTGILLQGKAGCDNTAYGAYGLQSELLKNVQLFCSNCSDKVKMDSKLFGDDTVNRITEPSANRILRHDVQLDL